MTEMENLFIRMDDESFGRLSSYVTREYGIKLPVNKRSMLESRLNKKVKSLGMDNYKDFLDFIFSDAGKSGDLFHVIDLITRFSYAICGKLTLQANRDCITQQTCSA